LMGGSSGLYFAEIRDDKQLLRREKFVKDYFKSSYKQCLEARERLGSKLSKKREAMVNDPVFQEAEIYFGWGTKVEGDDSFKTDWWLEVPHVQCRCGHNFRLVEEDRKMLKFPTKPDSERGIYVETFCKKCKRRINIFRNS